MYQPNQYGNQQTGFNQQGMMNPNMQQMGNQMGMTQPMFGGQQQQMRGYQNPQMMQQNPQMMQQNPQVMQQNPQMMRNPQMMMGMQQPPQQQQMGMGGMGGTKSCPNCPKMQNELNQLKTQLAELQKKAQMGGQQQTSMNPMMQQQNPQMMNQFGSSQQSFGSSGMMQQGQQSGGMMGQSQPMNFGTPSSSSTVSQKQESTTISPSQPQQQPRPVPQPVHQQQQQQGGGGGGGGSVQFGNTLYMVGYDGNMWKLSSRGKLEKCGSVPKNTTDMTYCNGQMFLVAQEKLYSFDERGKKFRRVGTNSVRKCWSLVSCGGNLFSISADGTMKKVDQTTAYAGSSVISSLRQTMKKLNVVRSGSHVMFGLAADGKTFEIDPRGKAKSIFGGKVKVWGGLIVGGHEAKGPLIFISQKGKLVKWISTNSKKEVFGLTLKKPSAICVIGGTVYFVENSELYSMDIQKWSGKPKKLAKVPNIRFFGY